MNMHKLRFNAVKTAGRWVTLALLLLPLAALAQRAAAPAFPLKVSENGRYLVDSGARPFLVVGDTAWSLIAQLNEADIAKYLDDRQRRGFNSIIVNLIEHKYASKAPAKIDGVAPFLKPGDLTQPNPAYFDYAHRAVAAANQRGITVWLCPAYLGAHGGDEGFFKEIKAAGPAALRSYGRFVGERFKDLPNIVWMPGGDYALPEAERWTGNELAEGLREGGARQIMTAHGGQTSSVETFGDQPWLAVDTVYRYQPDLWRPLRANYPKKPVRPFVLIEATYEGEHKATPELIRRQAWWAMLSGACGQFFGNSPMWHFDGPGLHKPAVDTTWQQALDSAGSRDMARLGAFFNGQPWPQLAPDLEDKLVSAGAGDGETRITAARTPDHRLALLYIPADGKGPRELTLNLTAFPGPVTAHWFNPAKDAALIAHGPAIPNRDGQKLSAPGDNGTGANDWALVLKGGIQPLRPSAAHPHYFERGGKPVILIGASDHFGSLMNSAFDYVRYLDVVSADGLNVMRVMSGVFTEPGRDGNTMEALPGKLITPYARGSEPGYANGGNKFDLSRWDDTYFARLRDLVAQAAKRNVVVNYIFFCPFMEDGKFTVSPWKGGNYVNGPAPAPWREIYTLDKGGGFVALQEALIRKVVAELKGADNVLFEIIYEGRPEWVRADWLARMTEVLLTAQREHGSKSPLIQDAGVGAQPSPNLVPEAAAVQWSFTRAEVMAPHWRLNRVLAQGETGAEPSSDDPARMRAWEFLHNGCGLYVHLDHCFSVGNPDGDCDMGPASMWGGGKAQRRELGALKRYWESLDFANFAPATNLVRGQLPPGLTVRAMANPGREYTVHLRPSDTWQRIGIRWTGKLRAPVSGDYELATISNDGVRLWLDGKQLVNNWTDHGSAEDVVKVMLDANKAHDLMIEFFYTGGQGEMRLLWGKAGQKRELIPAAAFTTGDGAPGLTAEYFAEPNLTDFKLRRTEPQVDWRVKGGWPFELPQFTGEPSVEFDLPAGRYIAEWILPKDAAALRSETFEHAGGLRRFNGPKMNPDLALRVRLAPSEAGNARKAAAKGPLTVLKANPRYFTDGSGKAVYLTGSHTWNSLQDMGLGDPPPAFDFNAYLDFLEQRQHNFIRLWHWEQVAWETEASADHTDKKGVAAVAPHPWARTGPGNALDGKPKFDLGKFDPAYFNRLRSRVQAAGERGIYVSVMLFEGWEHWSIAWNSHPFHKPNNMNGIEGDADGDGLGFETHTLNTPAITRLQEAYVRQVIDTVGDLDNVLYEIANESGTYSTEWHYHLIRFIKEYEKTKPKQHPVGMTFIYSRGSMKQLYGNAPDRVLPDKARPSSMKLLFDSPADWVSPNRDRAGGYDYRTNPAPADGRKVILSDTDHLWGIGGDLDWAWKSFLRGHNPIFMDPYDHSVLGNVAAEKWDPSRQSLGQTRRFAERVDLAAMTPSEDIASTTYCLANPGSEYLVYQPGKGKFTVDLTRAAGDLTVEWFDPETSKTTAGAAVKGGAIREFTPPVTGPVVLYLKAKP